MTDLESLMRTIDTLNDEEKHQLFNYLKQAQNPQPKQRIAGLHEHLGHAWMSDDFNDELPDSFA